MKPCDDGHPCPAGMKRDMGRCDELGVCQRETPKKPKLSAAELRQVDESEQAVEGMQASGRVLVPTRLFPWNHKAGR